MPEEKSFAAKRLVIYAIGFVFNLSYAIPTYVNSSFLTGFVGERLVGIIYTASSILAIAAFIEIADILKRWGNLKTTLSLIALQIFSLIGLAFGKGSLAIIASFLLNFVTIALVNFTLDVFLEEFSTDKHTGRIRGTFLTFVNLAWLISPTLSSLILGDTTAYGHMYAISAALLVPAAFLIYFGLRKIQDPSYERLPFWKSFASVWADRDLKGILFIQFLLQFFYAWMIIYTPIYLHENLGFDWTAIGTIFTVMLLPFIFIEGPLGAASDRIGEKKMLYLGFGILGASAAAVGLITDHNLWVWAAILFLTRCGAAIVEVMADTYFFKHVNATNTHIITFSRMARPLAYVISPVIATLLFTVFDTKGLFIFLGIFMLYGFRHVYALKDAK